jgi:hypothetical protein
MRTFTLVFNLFALLSFGTAAFGQTPPSKLDAPTEVVITIKDESWVPRHIADAAESSIRTCQIPYGGEVQTGVEPPVYVSQKCVEMHFELLKGAINALKKCLKTREDNICKNAEVIETFVKQTFMQLSGADPVIIE